MSGVGFLAADGVTGGSCRFRSGGVGPDVSGEREVGACLALDVVCGVRDIFDATACLGPRCGLAAASAQDDGAAKTNGIFDAIQDEGVADTRSDESEVAL